jgi:hypothetical protein
VKTGTQSTSEAAYTGYARVAIARSSGGFTVSNNTIVPAANIDFPICTAGTETENFWSIGVASSGATKILFYGAIGSAPVPVSGATSGVFTSPAHGLTTNDLVVFLTPVVGTLPTGVTEGTIYNVIATGLTTDAFEVSATQGGASITVSAKGVGWAQKVSPISVALNTIPRLTTSSTITID